jgi:hypothetical protein
MIDRESDEASDRRAPLVDTNTPRIAIYCENTASQLAIFDALRPGGT